MNFSLVQAKVFESCDGETAKFSTTPVSVIKGTELLEQTKLAKIADNLAQQCKNSTCVATVPEWWQLRPEAARKQAILLFREIRLDGTIGSDDYPITIPHFKFSNPPLTAPLGNYKKGNFEGILTLKDNSKVIVNCRDLAECFRVLEALKPYIEATQLEGSSIKAGERRGLPFKQIEVKPFRLDYYPTGVKSMKPAWLKAYS